MDKSSLCVIVAMPRELIDLGLVGFWFRKSEFVLLCLCVLEHGANGPYIVNLDITLI
jgi:hypothetical protein